MGEPLSPNCVFDFPMDEPEPQHVYDFFAPGPLPGYAGNLDNTNGWIETEVPLLGELGEMDEPLGAEEDLTMLFGDDDFNDDGLDDDKDDEEVWEMDEEWLMAPVTPPLMPVMPPPSTYKVGGSSTAAAEGHSLTLLAPGVPVPLSVIEDLCTRMGNLEYGHRQLVKKAITVSDAEVADSIAIREIGPRVSTVEGQMQVMASQMVLVMSRLEQVGAHVERGQQATTQRDETIAGLSQQCILGLDRRLADVERRSPRPK
ncbi:hypothetical protein Tco_0824201 [Tanacetum coccineum]|uniref:Uncharacterized protein n=1 Tax=Tanacetum coccineum TaxID=301880 RepID=A0ABQ5AMS1_9ASTR